LVVIPCDTWRDHLSHPGLSFATSWKRVIRVPKRIGAIFDRLHFQLGEVLLHFQLGEVLAGGALDLLALLFSEFDDDFLLVRHGDAPLCCADFSLARAGRYSQPVAISESRILALSPR